VSYIGRAGQVINSAKAKAVCQQYVVGCSGYMAVVPLS